MNDLQKNYGCVRSTEQTNDLQTLFERNFFFTNTQYCTLQRQSTIFVGLWYLPFELGESPRHNFWRKSLDTCDMKWSYVMWIRSFAVCYFEKVDDWLFGLKNPLDRIESIFRTSCVSGCASSCNSILIARNRMNAFIIIVVVILLVTRMPNICSSTPNVRILSCSSVSSSTAFAFREGGAHYFEKFHVAFVRPNVDCKIMTMDYGIERWLKYVLSMLLLYCNVLACKKIVILRVTQSCVFSSMMKTWLFIQGLAVIFGNGPTFSYPNCCSSTYTSPRA